MDAEHHVGAHVQAAHAGRSCWSILIDDVRAGREQARAGGPELVDGMMMMCQHTIGQGRCAACRSVSQGEKQGHCE